MLREFKVPLIDYLLRTRYLYIVGCIFYVLKVYYTKWGEKTFSVDKQNKTKNNKNKNKEKKNENPFWIPICSN